MSRITNYQNLINRLDSLDIRQLRILLIHVETQINVHKIRYAVIMREHSRLRSEFTEQQKIRYALFGESPNPAVLSTLAASIEVQRKYDIYKDVKKRITNLIIYIN